MSKRIKLLFALIIFIILLFGSFVLFSDDLSRKISTGMFSGSDTSKVSYNKMTATVKEVKSGSIIVVGTVLSFGLGENIENKTIELSIGPKTVFKKTVMRIPLASDATGAPEFKQEVGSLSDITPGMDIRLIESDIDLSSRSKASATVLNYDVVITPTQTNN